MKYNFTNETYLQETIRNFPGADSMTWLDILIASVYLNILPLLVSFICYYPIVFIVKKIIPRYVGFKLVLIGFLLTMTTPVLYFWASGWAPNNFYLKNAEIVAWIITFMISITVYFVWNKDERIKPS